MRKTLDLRLLIAVSASCAVLLAAGSAGAETAPAIDFTEGANVSDAAGFTLGYQFTANTGAAAVVGLATWDSWMTRPGSARVGLWDAAGDLLASASVSSSSRTIGAADWSYAAIQPLRLTPGATYVVGSWSADVSYSYFNSGLTIDPRIDFLQDAWIDANSLQFPSQTSYIDRFEGGGYFGGNVILGPVPEASTWTMMLVGFAGVSLAGWRARSQRTATRVRGPAGRRTTG